MSIIQDLFSINRQLSGNLYHISNGKNLDGRSPRLILPTKRDLTSRISEQESRVLYCNIINSHYSYYFSIETPTIETYQQTGLKAISALSDLSLYEKVNGKVEKIVNVEFKAHNVKEFCIYKDIEKLVREKITGNWFHTLKNADSGTLISLFQKFKNSFYKFPDIPISIVFCFCVLDKKWSCLKHFNFNPKVTDIETYTNKFFQLEYSAKNSFGNIMTIKNNDWIIFEDEDYIKYLNIFNSKIDL